MGDTRRLIGTRLRSHQKDGSTVSNCNLRIFCVLVIACFFDNSGSSAQHINPSVAPCQNVVRTMDMANCFDRALKKADLELNHTYVTVLGELKRRGAEDDLQNLRSVQRLWLQFRDASCKAERALYEGGTAAPIVYLGCLGEMTRQRTAYMKTTYSGFIVEFGNETQNGGRK